MLITTATILTETVNFEVGTDGMFTARTRDGEVLGRADSLKRAKRLARFELKKKQVRVAVPFTMLNQTTGQLTNAIAKGRHASSNTRVLIWIDDGTENGRSDTIDLYRWGSSKNYLRGDLTPKDVKRIEYLFEQKRKTEERLAKVEQLISDWRNDHTMDLNLVLDAALKEAAEAMQDTEEEEDTNEPMPPELDSPVSGSADTGMEMDIS